MSELEFAIERPDQCRNCPYLNELERTIRNEAGELKESGSMHSADAACGGEVATALLSQKEVRAPLVIKYSLAAAKLAIESCAKGVSVQAVEGPIPAVALAAGHGYSMRQVDCTSPYRGETHTSRILTLAPITKSSTLDS